MGVQKISGVWTTASGGKLSGVFADWAPGEPSSLPGAECAYASPNLG